MDVQRVLSEEKAQLRSFFFFFCPLDAGVEASLYLLHCQTVLPSFHCHHDFLIAVPCASITCHVPVLHVIKVHHVLELSGAESSTERQNRNNDMESF